MRDFIQSLFTPAPPCPPDLAMSEHLQRFQCQPWYVRLWRYRHYLPIPVKAIRWWLSDKLKNGRYSDPLDLYWGIATGLAQSPMRWYYTMFETFGRIQSRFGKDLAEQWREIFEEEP